MNDDLNEELVAHLRHRRRGDGKSLLDLRHFGPMDGWALRLIEEHHRLLRKFTDLNIEIEGGAFEAAKLRRLLASMGHLRGLALRLCLKESDTTIELAKGLSSLKLLRRFAMEVESVEGARATRTIAASIGRLGRVEEVSIRNSSFDGEALAALLSRGGRRLRTLDLANNVLSGDSGVRAFAKRSVRLDSLKTLDLSGNALEDSGVESLADLRSKAPRLEVLILESNGISPNGLFPLLRAIQAEPWRSSLKRLSLRGNKLESIPVNAQHRSDDPERWREYASSLLTPPPKVKSTAQPHSSPPTLRVAVPELIASLEPDQQPLSFDAQELYGRLRDKGREARSNRVPAHAWLSRSDWFHFRGNDRRRTDWQTLIQELLTAGLIEERLHGPKKQLRQYRAIEKPEKA